MTEQRIIEQLNHDINKYLKEELGIADEVSSGKELIFLKLREEYRNKNYEEKDGTEDGVGEKIGNFSVQLFGQTIFVNYTIYNFKDNLYRNNYIKKNGNSYLNCGSAVKYGESRTNRRVIALMYLNCESVSGNLINTEGLKDSIQHELEHIYQQLKSKNEFGSASLYSIVRENLYSENEYDASLAMVLYMSFKSEIEGYSNGLYAFVFDKLKSFNTNVNTIFKESYAYEKLQEVYKAKDFIEQHLNDKEFDIVFSKYSKYKINKSNIFKIIDETISELLTRFGKALVKARKDVVKIGYRSSDGIRYTFY